MVTFLQERELSGQFQDAASEPVVWSTASTGSIHVPGFGSQIETWKKKIIKHEHANSIND